MSCTQFKEALFIALADAAEAHPRGQPDVFLVAAGILPDMKNQWVSDAVTSYEAESLVFNVSKPGSYKNHRTHDDWQRSRDGRTAKRKSSKKFTIDVEKSKHTTINSG